MPHTSSLIGRPPATPQRLNAGRWYSARLPAMGYWRGELRVPSGPLSNHRVAVSIPGSSRVAIFGRRGGGSASATAYDWAHVVSPDGSGRTVEKRSVRDGIISLEVEMAPGEWQLAVLNDDETEAKTMRIRVEQVETEATTKAATANPLLASLPGASGCPNDCSGRGRCVTGGRCHCLPQFTGPDCSQSE